MRNQEARTGDCPVRETKPTVFVVDDDPDMRESLRDLVSSARLPVKEYESASGFLDDYDANASGCVLVDVRMPGMSGFDLQDRICAQGCNIPIIFITGYGDIQRRF